MKVPDIQLISATSAAIFFSFHMWLIWLERILCQSVHDCSVETWTYFTVLGNRFASMVLSSGGDLLTQGLRHGEPNQPVLTCVKVGGPAKKCLCLDLTKLNNRCYKVFCIFHRPRRKKNPTLCGRWRTFACKHRHLSLQLVIAAICISTDIVKAGTCPVLGPAFLYVSSNCSQWEPWVRNQVCDWVKGAAVCVCVCVATVRVSPFSARFLAVGYTLVLGQTYCKGGENGGAPPHTPTRRQAQ